MSSHGPFPLETASSLPWVRGLPARPITIHFVESTCVLGDTRLDYNTSYKYIL